MVKKLDAIEIAESGNTLLCPYINEEFSQLFSGRTIFISDSSKKKREPLGVLSGTRIPQSSGIRYHQNFINKKEIKKIAADCE